MSETSEQTLSGDIIEPGEARKQARPTGPVTVKLAKPIQNIDQTVSTVTLNPPTGRHLMKAGAVMRFITRGDSEDISTEVNPEGMGKLIAACGNLTIRAVESMAAADFNACSVALMPFLAPTETD